MAEQTPDRGTGNRGTENRHAGPAAPGSSGTPAAASRPLTIHVVYGNDLPITAAVRSAIESRIYATMAGVLPVFLVVHYGDIRPDEVAAFGARDIPVYLLRPEDARRVPQLVDRHRRTAVPTQAQLQTAFEAIGGGTMTAEAGVNLNFDIGGVRFGVSFVRVWAMPRQSAASLGTLFATAVLHEFGHHMLETNAQSAHHFGGIMDPVAMNVGAPPATFPPAAVRELRQRAARLP